MLQSLIMLKNPFILFKRSQEPTRTRSAVGELLKPGKVEVFWWRTRDVILARWNNASRPFTFQSTGLVRTWVNKNIQMSLLFFNKRTDLQAFVYLSFLVLPSSLGLPVLLMKNWVTRWLPAQVHYSTTNRLFVHPSCYFTQRFSLVKDQSFLCSSLVKPCSLKATTGWPQRCSARKAPKIHWLWKRGFSLEGLWMLKKYWALLLLVCTPWVTN